MIEMVPGHTKPRQTPPGNPTEIDLMKSGFLTFLNLETGDYEPDEV
jgi:hypothetical protein